MQKLVLYQKVYDFMLYIFPIIDRFPKYEKFALCTELKNTILKLHTLTIRANKSKRKKQGAYEIDICLEELRMLIRFSHDRKYLSKKSYEHSSKLLLEIGKILGGWIKTMG